MTVVVIIIIIIMIMIIINNNNVATLKKLRGACYYPRARHNYALLVCFVRDGGCFQGLRERER